MVGADVVVSKTVVVVVDGCADVVGGLLVAVKASLLKIVVEAAVEVVEAVVVVVLDVYDVAATAAVSKDPERVFLYAGKINVMAIFHIVMLPFARIQSTDMIFFLFPWVNINRRQSIFDLQIHYFSFSEKTRNIFHIMKRM